MLGGGLDKLLVGLLLERIERAIVLPYAPQILSQLPRFARCIVITSQLLPVARELRLRLAKLLAWPRSCSAAGSGRRRGQNRKRNQLSDYPLQQ